MHNWAISANSPRSFKTAASKYLFDFWIYYCDVLEGNAVYTDFINPRVVIEEILGECKHNHLNNKNNREYFTRTIEMFTGVDASLRGELKIEMDLLKKAITDHDSFTSILYCEKLISAFSSDSYISDLTEIIANTASASVLSDSVKSKLKYHTKSLIISFLYKGYKIKDVEKFIINAFDQWSYTYKEWVITNFPIDIDILHDFDDTDIQVFMKNDIIIDYIEQLSVYERVKSILKLIDPQKHQFSFIHEIENLVTNGSTLKFGDVTFGGLKDNPFGEDMFLSTYKERDENGNILIYAFLAVEAHSINEATEKSVYKIDRSLKVLTFFQNNREEIKIGSRFSYHSDRISGSGNLFDHRELLRFYDEPERLERFAIRHFSESYRDNLAKYFASESPDPDSEQIYNSLEWFLKADSATSIYETIPYLWTCIESVLTHNSFITQSSMIEKRDQRKEEIVVKYLPYIAVRGIFREKVFDLYFKIYGIASSLTTINGVKSSGIVLSDHQMITAGYNDFVGKEISLSYALDGLKYLANEVENELLRDLIKEVIEIYIDNRKSETIVDRVLQNAKDNIYTIYRYRNQITHSGQLSSRIHKYVAETAREYSMQMLGVIINSKVEFPNRKIEEALARIRMKIDVDLVRLKRGDLIDAERIQTWSDSSK